MYKENTDNKCCQLVIVNVLKYVFINTRLKRVLEEYNHTVLPTFNAQGEEKYTTLTTMNDDDVNRYFGWALIKTKKYHKQQIASVNDIILDIKLEMLDGMSTILVNALNNKYYSRLYYPL